MPVHVPTLCLNIKVLLYTSTYIVWLIRSYDYLLSVQKSIT